MTQKSLNLFDILKRFKPFYIEYKLYFALAIFGMLLTAGGTAFAAWLLDPVLNKVFLEKNVELLYILPLAVILAYFTKSLGLYMQVYFISFVGFNVLKKLRQKALHSILRLDMSFFHKTRSGELISRITNDINSLQSIVSSIIPEFLRESLVLIGLLCVVIYQSPILAFFALIVIPAAIYPLRLFAKKLKKYALKMQEKNSDLLSKLSEIFSNIELVKANTNEQKESFEFKQANKEICKLNTKSIRIDSLIPPMMETLGAIGLAAVLIIGGLEVIEGNLNIGKFVSFNAALFMAYTPVKKLSNLYARLQNAVAASERTFYILDLKANIKDGTNSLQSIEKIRFEKVYFAYDEKPVLRGVDLEFKRGKILALVGESGGGKSSIINLLLRFYDKTDGKIYINDKDINEYFIKDLRSKIGLVTQNIYIFNKSIAQNIAYSEKFDEEKVKKALKLANAYEFVEKMGGIHTKLFEHGKNLSGGQKQRIAIARALYKNPDFLIFDEATSALDNESEKAIVKSIENLRKEKLILIIAHRLSTIENADTIAVIDKGEVVGFGNDKELLQTCKLYQKFKNKELKI